LLPAVSEVAPKERFVVDEDVVEDKITEDVVELIDDPKLKEGAGNDF